MRKVLVIGGAGYIGAHASKMLRSAGVSPVVYDSLVAGHRSFVKWGKFVKGDVSDRRLLKAVFKAEKINAVLHFAAYASVGESVENPAKYYDNNLSGTLALLDAMRDSGVKTLVFSSSAAVYGEPIKVPISEGHPKNPVNPYGRTKFFIEEAVADYSRAYSMKFTCLRYFNAAGADPAGDIGESHYPETHLIPLVLCAASGGPAIKVYGGNYETPDGTCLRDYVHVTDLADAHYLALKRLWSGGDSQNYNLGNGKAHSVLQVIDAAEKHTGKRIPFVMAPRRVGDPAVLVASSVLAKRDLRWRPRLSVLDRIISTAWSWHMCRKNGVHHRPDGAIDK